MNKNVFKVGLVCISILFLCACVTVEETQAPTITSKPKVMIVDAATPTPTLTPKKGEENTVPAETPVPVPEGSETPVPTQVPTAMPTEAPEPTKAPTAAPEPTKAPTAAPKPTQAPTATPIPTPEEILPYKKGLLTETEFKSEWLGLKLAAEDGIELAPQEELDETMRLMEEAVTGKTITGALNYEKLGVVYEMTLTWQDKGLTMQVLVEQMEDSRATGEDYVLALREELNMLEENGFTYTVDDKTYSETIGGKEFLNFGYTAYFGNNISLHQENYIRKQGDRIIFLSIMGESEAGMDELLEKLTAY